MKPTTLTATTPPQGFLGRLATAAKALKTGRPLADNPLSQPPEDVSRAALVQELTKWCQDTREFWRPVFDRMREEQMFAGGKQWDSQYVPRTGQKEPYIGDVCQQMINRQTATLYAKNPTPEGTVVDRMEFSIWDGDQSAIDAAQQIVIQATPIIQQARKLNQQRQMLQQQGVPPEQLPPSPPAPPQDLTDALDLLNDYRRGMAKKSLYKKIVTTATKLLEQQWRDQSPNMLVSGKQATAQVLVSRVAYIKVMYRRDMETVPTTTANDMAFSDRIKTLQGQLAALQEDSMEQDDPRRAEAELLKKSIKEQTDKMKAQQPPPVIGDEGVVHDWLGATAVLVDRKCTNLIDFVGANRIAHEMFLDPAECEAKYEISLKDSGAVYYDNSEGPYKRQEPESYSNTEQEVAAKKYKVCVWELQDKRTGLCYTLIDGVKDFIKEPETQDDFTRFWSIISLRFNLQVVEENDPERDVTIFSRSQIRLAMPMQRDMNTAGEGLREHRVANRPTFVGVKSKFASTAGVNDLEKLARPRAAFDLINIETLQPGEKVADFIQLLPIAEIDEKMYDNAQSSQAMMLATGEQPSDLGTQSPDEKATGQNIAAQARATSVGSNIDDLDIAYSTMAQMDFELLVRQMTQAQVQAIVGPGGVWADLAHDEVLRAMFFRIEAGSTGRPNEQADLQNFNVIAPQLGKLMTDAGKDLEPLIKEGVRRMGDKLDVDEFLKPAQIVAPPTPAPPVQKPPSLAMSINVADLPPEEQEQAVQQFGIKPAPPASRLINKIGHEKAVDAAHANVLHAQGTPPTATLPPQP